MLDISYVTDISSLTGCSDENPGMEQTAEEQLSAEKCYQSDELHSRPFITPNSDIPEKLLQLSYPLTISFEGFHFIQANWVMTCACIMLLYAIYTFDNKMLLKRMLWYTIKTK